MGGNDEAGEPSMIDASGILHLPSSPEKTWIIFCINNFLTEKKMKMKNKKRQKQKK